MQAEVVSLEELPMGGEEIVDPRVDLEADHLRDYEMQRLWRHVKKLPPLERGVICLRAGFEGSPLTVRQIATRLGMGRSTVSRIERRGLEKLADYYLLEALAA